MLHSHLWKSRQGWNAEVDLPIFGRWTISFEVLAERKYGKLNFRSLAAKAGSAETELHILRSIGRAEVRNWFHITSLVARPDRKCESRILDLWQSCQVGSVEAELYIFDRSLSYWLSLLTNNSTDCYNRHSQWRTKWRPGVAKIQDFRNALDKIIMVPQGIWVILIWALS